MSQPVSHSVDGLTRFRVDFAYDGSDFIGWAKQPGLRTVQGELLAALTKIFGESENDFGMRVAGRTDAGVHAANQVAHIDLNEQQLKRLGRSTNLASKLNGMLTEEIRVHRVELAPAGFDARFSAIYRRYRFRISDTFAPKDPQQLRYVLNLGYSLDTKAMNEAAQLLIGLKDFASFCKAREGATTIRNLKQIQVKRDASHLINIELKADAFCHNMVRSIVGALIAVGSGKATAEDLQRTLDRASRTQAYKVVEPKGLTLMEIGYPKDSQLAAQALRARAKRSEDES
jgi:tRNA pseudouridine38-40 synthase